MGVLWWGQIYGGLKVIEGDSMKNNGINGYIEYLAAIWKYMEDDTNGDIPTNGWATCRLCRHPMQYRYHYSATYSNLSKHLKQYHPAEYLEYKKSISR